jgi:TonB family protein
MINTNYLFIKINNMKFNSSKFITGSVIAFVILSLMTACGEPGTDSTKATESENKPSESTGTTDPSSPQPDATTSKKKTGKASIGMTVNADANAKIEKDKMGYYNYTEVLPAYNGGQSALETYINSNIEYPQAAIDNSTEGTVSVQFSVDEQGNVSNAKAIGDKIGYGLEEEAVRVVAQMPKWTAGQVKGKNVKTWRILPVTYKLES